METSLQTLVAEYTRKILAGLDSAAREAAVDEPDVATAFRQTGDLRPAAKIAKIVLDIHDAETLGGGSLLGSEHPEQATACWVIYVRAETQREPGLIEFQLRGIVSAALDPLQFVATSYRHVLNRTVDGDGEALYSSLLTSGKLSQRDVLSILASSEEAQDRHERLLIVPSATTEIMAVAAEAASSGSPYCVLVPV